MCRLGFCVHACFNTQPPEGGWIIASKGTLSHETFQHTAARRRLAVSSWNPFGLLLFQHTAARRRLVDITRPKISRQTVSTHSRPKAAGAA